MWFENQVSKGSQASAPTQLLWTLCYLQKSEILLKFSMVAKMAAILNDVTGPQKRP